PYEIEHSILEHIKHQKYMLKTYSKIMPQHEINTIKYYIKIERREITCFSRDLYAILKVSEINVIEESGDRLKISKLILSRIRHVLEEHNALLSIIDEHNSFLNLEGEYFEYVNAQMTKYN
ncbi:MAG: hypothetical protein ACRC5M_07075, partial [Anaeroplasmataceae bacterium]